MEKSAKNNYKMEQYYNWNVFFNPYAPNIEPTTKIVEEQTKKLQFDLPFRKFIHK